MCGGQWGVKMRFFLRDQLSVKKGKIVEKLAAR
jgi:hypothetical protein